MKNLALTFLAFLIISVSACHDEPASVRELPLLGNDSVALADIAAAFRTMSENYPRQWSASDRSTWPGTIELDTVLDPATMKPALAVSAITLYIPEKRSPMSLPLRKLKHVRDFRLYACPGAFIAPSYIPLGCDSVLIEKIDPDAPGYILIYDDEWVTSKDMYLNEWAFAKIVVHGVAMKTFRAHCAWDAIIDLSDNLLEGPVTADYTDRPVRANLSHNKFTRLSGNWEYWVWSKNVPNLQYNDIPIPEEILGTDFWKENHQWFIGNPGYVAPE